MFSFKKQPPLTYSVSRANRLKACESSYYFQFYESTFGWQQDASQTEKTAYALKKLQPVEALFGTAIHNAASNLITNLSLSLIDLKKSVNTTMRINYRNSMARRAEWLNDQRLFTMIQEVYYHGEVDKMTQQKIIDKIDICCKNLFSNKSLSDIRYNSNIITIDEFQEYYFDETKVSVKIDAIFQDRTSGNYILLDWKTGKGGSEDYKQILLYTYFAHKMFQIPTSKIETRLEYLLEGETAVYTFSDDDMKIAEAEIRNDIITMESFLYDKEKNIPKLASYFKQNVTSKCKYCNFRQICIRESYMFQHSVADVCAALK